MKRAVFVLGMLGAAISRTLLGGGVYDAGEALAANLGKGGTFTDCKGGTWTFGTIGAGDLSDVQPLGGAVGKDGWFEGVAAANNSLTPPYALVNTSDTPQAHGGETGYNVLAPGEIVLHPDNPANSARPYVGIRFAPPRAGVYRVDVAARDMSYGAGNSASNGVIVSICANGMIQQSTRIGRERGVTNTAFAVALYLPAEGAVTLIVDPSGAYNYDSTAVYFTMTEEVAVSGDPVVNLNEAYADILRSEATAMPATAGAVTVDCGLVSGKTEQAFATRHAETAINCDGFAAANGFPYVLINTNDVQSACDNRILIDHRLMPHELLLHPDTSQDVFIRFTVPSAGVYRVSCIVRDVNADHVIVSGRGVVANIAAKGWCRYASGYVSAEDGDGPIVLDARRLELAQGDTVAVSINNNGVYNCDATGLQVFLFADAPPSSDEVVNLDINGRQPSDPEPVTYTGAAIYAAAGTFWNAVYGLENSVQSVSGVGLRTAGGRRTFVNMAITSTDGTNLMFDNLANDANKAGNDLLNDYLYVNHTNRLVIAGLVPGNSYDLHLFSACGKTNALRDTRAVFGGQTRVYIDQGGSVFQLNSWGDVTVFSGLVADEAGVIEGLLIGTPQGQGVFNGFQLVGEFTFPPPGTVVVVR
ncbi:MAG: hypothetical protein IJI36_16930 [Kiritimatiellae bacterium]|nr:hypothetical protein [Kiritimatiellia bacterium]